MAVDNLPENIIDKYETYEWRHASAILKEDFTDEYGELVQVLDNFVLKKSDILTPGGRKSRISKYFDQNFEGYGWEETNFDASINVDDKTYESPTHKIDCFKNRIGIEIEWNNKDPFYDRDLNNFRLLHELRALSVGVFITRCDGLQDIFDELGKGSSYGASTTHMSKLKPRINGGAGGGCPILAFGIRKKLYDPNE